MKITKRRRSHADTYREPPISVDVKRTVELLKEVTKYMEMFSDKKDRDIVFRRYICYFGTQHQIDMMIEEMRGLEKALLKWRRVKDAGLTDARDCIIDGLADVLIMARQMEILFQAEDEVEGRIDFKVQRQLKRLEELGAKNGKN